MDDEALVTALLVARSAVLLSSWEPRDWPDLAVEDYLDCDCLAADRARESELEAELENLTPVTLPDNVIYVLTRPLRSTLPASQPPHGHGNAAGADAGR